MRTFCIVAFLILASCLAVKKVRADMRAASAQERIADVIEASYTPCER